MDAGHPAVGQELGAKPEGGQHGDALLGHRLVGRPGGDHQHPTRAARAGRHTTVGQASAAGHRPPSVPGRRGRRGRRVDLVVVGPGQQDRSASARSRSSTTIAAHCSGVLPGPVDGLGKSLAQRPVMVDPGEAEVGEGQAPQLADGIVGRAGARRHIVEQLAERGLVHAAHYPARCDRDLATSDRAIFGPAGTFTEEALLSQPDYARSGARAAADHRRGPRRRRARARSTLASSPWRTPSRARCNATLDALVFDSTCSFSARSSSTSISPDGAAGHVMADVERVAVVPRRQRPVPAVPGRQPARGRGGGHQLDRRGGPELGENPEPGTAAIAPRLAAELYGLAILAEDVEDHPGQPDPFVAVAAHGVPAPTGHDRTSIVCFQQADRPGSLHGILGAVLRPQHQPDQARVPTDQAGPRRLLLRDRPRRPPRRRGGRRLPSGPSRRVGRGEVPRSYPAAGPTARSAGARPTRPGGGRCVAGGVALPDELRPAPTRSCGAAARTGDAGGYPAQIVVRDRTAADRRRGGMAERTNAALEKP